MFLKLSADPEIDLNNDALLKFACFAKNSLLNKDGFSPFQLVYGSGPRISSLLENRPPALDCSTSSLAVANLTSALNLSRKAFSLEADCSNRIRKALLANVRNDNGPFLQGQSVYYKKDGENRWRGPGKIVGTENAVIFIRHGGSLIKEHRKKFRQCQEDHSHDFQKVSRDEPNGKESLTSGTENKGVIDTVILEDEDEESSGMLEDIDSSKSSVQEMLTDYLPSSGAKNFVVKVGERLDFTSGEAGFEGEKIQAIVKSRGGKASGQYKNWWNVEYTKPEELLGRKDCVDVSKTKSIPQSPSQEDFSSAKSDELRSWAENDVYSTVQNVGGY